MDKIETPRLVKKPDGSRKRVENQDELDAALADGWKVRLDEESAPPAAAPEPDATPESATSDEAPDLASALTADLERQEDEAKTTKQRSTSHAAHGGAKKK